MTSLLLLIKYSAFEFTIVWLSMLLLRIFKLILTWLCQSVLFIPNTALFIPVLQWDYHFNNADTVCFFAWFFTTLQNVHGLLLNLVFGREQIKSIFYLHLFFQWECGICEQIVLTLGLNLVQCKKCNQLRNMPGSLSCMNADV